MSKRLRKRANGATERPFPGLLFFAVIVLAIVAFWNSLGNGFVFDDITLILQNPTITELNWGEILRVDSYRPVRTFTYALNYALGGANPFGFHLFNVLLHGLNAGMVFLLLWQLTRSRWVCGMGAAFFAVHPVQTAAVAYVSGRKDLLAGFFLLAGINLFLRYRSRPRELATLIAAFVCFMLAVLSKEVAIVFPALLLLVDTWVEANDSAGKPAAGSLATALWATIRRRLPLYGSFTVVAGLALYWAVFINQASRMEGYWGGSLETNIGTSFKLFAHYLKLSIFPHPLIADYTGDVFPISTGLFEWATVLSILATVLFAAAGWRIFGRAPVAGVGLLFFLIALLPVLQIIPFHELAADHFLYVPLIGAALAVGSGAGRLARGRRGAIFASGLAVAVGSVFLIATHQRNQTWKDRESLWSDTLSKAPGSYRANSNLGYVRFQQGFHREGIELTRKSIEILPQEAVSRSNLGAMYYKLGQEARLRGSNIEAVRLQRLAIHYLERATRLDPGDPFAFSNLGNTYKELALIYDQRNDPQEALRLRMEAVKLYRRALEIGDRRAAIQGVWMNFGGLMIDAGELSQAPYYLERYLAAFPDNPQGNYWMGYCYFEMKEFEKAIPYLEKVVAVEPTLEAQDRLARSYEQAGRERESIELYQTLLREGRASVEVLFNLGVLYKKVGEEARGNEFLNQALELEPTGQFSVRIRELLRRSGDQGFTIRPIG